VRVWIQVRVLQSYRFGDRSVQGELHESRHVVLRRGRMHYLSAGAGTPVVALHGWPGYSADLASCATAGVHVRAGGRTGFFGFGDSDRLSDPATEPGGEEALAADVIDLLDALAMERVILAGYDVGSAVAPAVARLAPGRVTGLLLLNATHPLIGDKQRSPHMIAESWYQHFHLLRLAPRLLDGNADALRLYLGHFYNHWGGERKLTASQLEKVVEVYARPGAFTASLRWYQARAARRLLAAPASPPLETATIALWGDRDPMRPLDHREGFEESFPNSESRVLEGVGHFVPHEAPGQVADALRELATAQK
jgi:pimeloyl-ACP methyl ester carboxylesterase